MNQINPIETGTILRETRKFSQEDFDLFAAVSGDDNPIHVDPVFSAETRFGRTVAHGMLLYTSLRGMMARHFPVINQHSQNLMFPAPTFTDEDMELLLTVTGRPANDQVALDVEIRRVADGVTTLSGDCILNLKTGN